MTSAHNEQLLYCESAISFAVMHFCKKDFYKSIITQCFLNAYKNVTKKGKSVTKTTEFGVRI